MSFLALDIAILMAMSEDANAKIAKITDDNKFAISTGFSALPIT